MASAARRSIAHTHVNVRVWTTTSAVSLLAVTEKRVVSSGSQGNKPLQDHDLPGMASVAWRSSAQAYEQWWQQPFISSLWSVDCHLRLRLPRSDKYFNHRHRERGDLCTDPPLLCHRERSVAIHFTRQPVVETLNNFVYPLTSPRIRQASFFCCSIYKIRHSVMNLYRNDNL